MVSRSVAGMLTLLRFVGSVLVRRFSGRAVLEAAVRDRPLAPGLRLRGIILPASRPRLLDFLMTRSVHRLAGRRSAPARFKCMNLARAKSAAPVVAQGIHSWCVFVQVELEGFHSRPFSHHLG